MVARMRPLRLAPLLLALLLACGEEAPIPAGHTPPPPATTGPTTDPGLTAADSTTGAASPCGCDLGQYCAAEYVPGDPEPLPEVFECRAECLPPAAPGFWCYDDASCCSGSCRDDGLCEAAPAETDGSTTGSTTEGSTTDGSTTGSTTGASTTDGSTTDGSTTGASTTDASSSSG